MRSTGKYPTCFTPLKFILFRPRVVVVVGCTSRVSLLSSATLLSGNVLLGCHDMSKQTIQVRSRRFRKAYHCVIFKDSVHTSTAFKAILSEKERMKEKRKEGKKRKANSCPLKQPSWVWLSTCSKHLVFEKLSKAFPEVFINKLTCRLTAAGRYL